MSTHIVKTVYKDKSKLEIVLDENPQSPDTWDDNELFLLFNHRDFYVSRGGLDARNIFNNPEDYSDEYWIFSVYAYIHSGVSLSLSNSSYPFNDRWDVSQGGFVLVRKDEADETVTESHAFKSAKSLIDEWNNYLSGEVYGYKLYSGINWTKTYEDGRTEEGTDWELEDSCYGYYSRNSIDEIVKDLGFENGWDRITIKKSNLVKS